MYLAASAVIYLQAQLSHLCGPSGIKTTFNGPYLNQANLRVPYDTWRLEAVFADDT